MKFFTPDLLERFASEHDRIALPAHDELERRSFEYHEHLKGIAKKLPPRFLEMQDRFYLHDAKVFGSGSPWLNPEFLRFPFPKTWPDIHFRSQECGVGSVLSPSLILVLQLDPPPQEFLVLHYRHARISAVAQYPPLEEKLPFLEWQHDEVELEVSGETRDFDHSILFTNGFEITIRFRDFDYAILKPLAHPSEVEPGSSESATIR